MFGFYTSDQIHLKWRQIPQNLQSHVLSVPDLATFVQNKYAIYDEYKDIPVITSRIEEMLYGCEDKNR